MNLENLFSLQNNAVKNISTAFSRGQFSRNGNKHRAIAVTGARGSGRTTALLQDLIRKQKSEERALYVRYDRPYLFGQTLEDVAHMFSEHGGRHLIIDDIHKDPEWSVTVRHIIERFPDLTLTFSALTVPETYREKHNVATRHLSCMSLREFIAMKYDMHLPVIPLEHVVRFHRQFAEDIIARLDPLPVLQEYMLQGCLPATVACQPESVQFLLHDLIIQTIDHDLCAAKDYTRDKAQNLKRILGVIAGYAPGKLNVSAMARKFNLGRDTVNQFVRDLAEARLITLLNRPGKQTSQYQKPDKVYLHNPNICHALQIRPDSLAVARTFLLNQLKNAGIDVRVPKKGDFLLDGTYTFEVKANDKRGNTGHNHYQIVPDVVRGLHRRVPLWLFGFLY